MDFNTFLMVVVAPSIVITVALLYVMRKMICCWCSKRSEGYENVDGADAENGYGGENDAENGYGDGNDGEQSAAKKKELPYERIPTPGVAPYMWSPPPTIFHPSPTPPGTPFTGSK
jgi:hypothetical protein